MKISLFFILSILMLTSIPSWAQEKNECKYLVATLNCGADNQPPFLIKGDSWKLPESLNGKGEMATCDYGNTLIYAFNHLLIDEDYALELSFLADEARTITISADGNEVCPEINIPQGKVLTKHIMLPRKAFAYGQLVLVISRTSGTNAIVNSLKLYSSKDTKIEPFDAEKRRTLSKIKTYTVDTTVVAEKVLPVYAPIADKVEECYNSKLSLNGMWQFSTSSENPKWQPIKVPGEWRMQGFEVDSAQYALYSKKIELPRDWKNQCIRLRFDAVHSECILYVNGKEMGRHQGGMTPFETDITTALQNGQNEICVKVKSESESDMLGSLTQYAAHQLGGITRKVTLFALPYLQINDVRVVTDLDDAYKNALLKVYVSLYNSADTTVTGAQLQFNLIDTKVKDVVTIPSIPAHQSWKGWITMKVNNPLLWDNEHPNLYSLNVELRNGTFLESLTKRVGFREVEVRGNQLFVNGKEVKLRGVCRHEVDPLTGRVLTDAQRWQDAKLYMDANCNYIRTSHYPPGEDFLNACDELGLFVEVEAPVCWIGHGANKNWQRLNYKDKHYYEYVLQANMETIQHYRNHPSILYWSIANESYWNGNFAQVLEYVKKADPTRPNTFHDQSYGGFNNQGSTAAIANIHYPGPSGYNECAKSARPMVYGEFCHLNTYNRRELETDPGVRSDWAKALEPTWEKMYTTKGALGGSIWSGIDDIFQLPDGQAVGYGAWGPIDGWRRPKPEYWDMKKIFSPIKVMTQTLQPNKKITLEIENRYTFTNLNEVKLLWSYGNEKGQLYVDVAPKATGKVVVPIKNIDNKSTLHLEFIDPKGFVADVYDLNYPIAKDSEAITTASQRTSLKNKKATFIIKGRNFECVVNRATGMIEKVEMNKKISLVHGPQLMVLPLQGGGCFPNHNANIQPFNDLCANWKATSVVAERQGENVLVKVEGAYDNYKGSYSYLVNSNGTIEVDYNFEVLQNVNPRQWGMVFEAPADYTQSFWKRKGRWSFYPENHISRPEGSAELFYPEVKKQSPRVKPSWSWEKDENAMGSNDFRSTRCNIYHAGLINNSGDSIIVHSDGQQHWRCWLNQDRINFLVANFDSPGAEMFLGGHYAPYRHPLKKGDHIKGHIVIELK